MMECYINAVYVLQSCCAFIMVGAPHRPYVRVFTGSNKWNLYCVVSQVLAADDAAIRKVVEERGGFK